MKTTLETISAKLVALTVSVAMAGSAGATIIILPLPAGTVATQSSSYGGGTYPATNAIDGLLNNFTHTDVPETNATWTLTLGSNMDFQAVRIWNRGDGCCQGRLRDITVTAFSDAGGTNQIFNSGTLNIGDVLGGPQRIDALTGIINARVLKISRAAYDPNSHDGSVLSLGEVQLLQDSILPLGTDLTRAGITGMNVSQTSTNGGFVALNGVNGVLGDFTHTLGTDTAPAWTVNFGEMMSLQSVNLHNRENCCPSRLRDITIEVLDASNSVVFTSALLNAENILGGGTSTAGPTDLFLDFEALNGGNPVQGQTVRVRRTSDPDLSGSGGIGNADEASVLSLGEVTVRGGTLVPEPGSIAMLGVAGLSLAMRRRKRS